MLRPPATRLLSLHGGGRGPELRAGAFLTQAQSPWSWNALTEPFFGNSCRFLSPVQLLSKPLVVNVFYVPDTVPGTGMK